MKGRVPAMPCFALCAVVAAVVVIGFTIAIIVNNASH
jgi:hypothetical protein